MISLLSNCIRDRRGSMAIETALVAPVLAVLALGSFEVGSLVSRQHELQTAAAEGEAIALAAAGGATVELATISEILETSLSLDEEQITITRQFRCNAETVMRSAASQCAEDDVVSSYVRIALTDTYNPVWTDFGVGGPISLNIERTVQIS